MTDINVMIEGQDGCQSASVVNQTLATDQPFISLSIQC